MSIEGDLRAWREKLAISRPKNKEIARLGEFMLFLTENISPDSIYANNAEIFGHFKRFIELLQTSKKVSFFLINDLFFGLYSTRIHFKLWIKHKGKIPEISKMIEDCRIFAKMPEFWIFHADANYEEFGRLEDEGAGVYLWLGR